MPKEEEIKEKEVLEESDFGVPDFEEGEPDTEPETDEQETKSPEPPDTEGETGEPKDELLAKYNLDKRYGDIDTALRSLTETQAEIERQRQENAELRRMHEQVIQKIPEQKPLEPDDLVELLSTNPVEGLKKAGVVTEDKIYPIAQAVQEMQQSILWSAASDSLGGIDDPEVAKLRTHLRANKSVPQPGENKVWDAMAAEIERFPHLRTMPVNEALPLAYELAEKRLPSSPDVPPVSKERKRRASTTGSGQTPAGGVADMKNWSAAKIRKYYEEHGMID